MQEKGLSSLNADQQAKVQGEGALQREIDALQAEVNKLKL